MLEYIAFVNKNNTVVMSQFCDIVNSLKEFQEEVSKIKTCGSEKVCGISALIWTGVIWD